MKAFKEIAPDYINILESRTKTSKVYQSHQLIGLQLADILEDRKHKALYMKLAKNNDPQKLLGMAKRVAENQQIINKGAYFMKVFFDDKKGIKLPQNYSQKNYGSK